MYELFRYDFRTEIERLFDFFEREIQGFRFSRPDLPSKLDYVFTDKYDGVRERDSSFRQGFIPEEDERLFFKSAALKDLVQEKIELNLKVLSANFLLSLADHHLTDPEKTECRKSYLAHCDNEMKKLDELMRIMLKQCRGGAYKDKKLWNWRVLYNSCLSGWFIGNTVYSVSAYGVTIFSSVYSWFFVITRALSNLYLFRRSIDTIKNSIDNGFECLAIQEEEGQLPGPPTNQQAFGWIGKELLQGFFNRHVSAIPEVLASVTASNIPNIPVISRLADVSGISSGIKRLGKWSHNIDTLGKTINDYGALIQSAMLSLQNCRDTIDKQMRIIDSLEKCPSLQNVSFFNQGFDISQARAELIKAYKDLDDVHEFIQKHLFQYACYQYLFGESIKSTGFKTAQLVTSLGLAATEYVAVESLKSHSESFQNYRFWGVTARDGMFFTFRKINGFVNYMSPAKYTFLKRNVENLLGSMTTLVYPPVNYATAWALPQWALRQYGPFVQTPLPKITDGGVQSDVSWIPSGKMEQV